MASTAVSFLLALISLLSIAPTFIPVTGFVIGIYSIVKIRKKGTPRMKYAATISTVLNGVAIARIIVAARGGF